MYYPHPFAGVFSYREMFLRAALKKKFFSLVPHLAVVNKYRCGQLLFQIYLGSSGWHPLVACNLIAFV